MRSPGLARPVTVAGSFVVLAFAFSCAESELQTSRPENGGSGGSAGSAVAGSGGTTTLTAGGNGSGGGIVTGTSGTGGSGGTATATAGAGGDEACGGAGGDTSCGDACPDDPDKTEPGECGCGVPDVDTGTLAGCTGLKAALVHRYSFDGTGATIEDTVGDADGEAKNVTLSGNGLLTLSGSTSDQYGELPAGIISELTNATFELWVNWTATDQWQRLFDFGVSDNGAGMQGNGDSYLFLAPKTFRFCYKKSGADEVVLDAPANMPNNATTHVAAVFDDSNNTMRLYLNGMLQGSVSVTGSLSEIDDLSNWLGRSQFSPDPEFGGSLREFRIYNKALTQAQITASFEFGEAPAFLEPAP